MLCSTPAKVYIKVPMICCAVSTVVPDIDSPYCEAEARYCRFCNFCWQKSRFLSCRAKGEYSRTLLSSYSSVTIWNINNFQIQNQNYFWRLNPVGSAPPTFYLQRSLWLYTTEICGVGSQWKDPASSPPLQHLLKSFSVSASFLLSPWPTDILAEKEDLDARGTELGLSLYRIGKLLPCFCLFSSLPLWVSGLKTAEAQGLLLGALLPVHTAAAHAVAATLVSRLQ